MRAETLDRVPADASSPSRTRPAAICGFLRLALFVAPLAKIHSWVERALSVIVRPEAAKALGSRDFGHAAQGG